MVNIVNGLLFRNEQLLVARRSHERSAYLDTWSFPGGHVEDGESLEQALKRELIEEIGIVPTAFAFLMQLGDRQSSLDRAITFHLFCVDEWKGEPKLLGDEHSELRWVDLRMAASLPDLALPSYSTVFEILLRR